MDIKKALRLYKKLPAPVQRILFLWKARRDSKSRFSGAYKGFYHTFVHNWTAPLAYVLDYQTAQLRHLLKESATHSPYFKEVFREAGISAADIQANPAAVVARLPFMDKTTIRNHLDALVSNNPLLPPSGFNYTSGSTGAPMKTVSSDAGTQISFALWKRYHHSLGLAEGAPSVRFSGNAIIPAGRKKPPFWLYNPYEQRLFFSIYHLTASRMAAYIQKLHTFKPVLLDGYPSGMYAIANYMANNGLRLPHPPKAICTTAEPLTELIREKLESAFECRVYNQYSSSEGGIFIAECTAGRLHVHLDSGYVEYLNSQGQAGSPGEVCELVICGFRNLKTPLIRYRTGDFVKLAEAETSGEKPCACGTFMPAVAAVYGRVEDYLLDENGIEQGMVSYRTFKMASNILKAQVIQRAPNAVTARIVKDKGYTPADEQYVAEKLRGILGASVQVTFEYCADIEGGANGKFKTVVREPW